VLAVYRYMSVPRIDFNLKLFTCISLYHAVLCYVSNMWHFGWVHVYI